MISIRTIVFPMVIGQALPRCPEYRGDIFFVEDFGGAFLAVVAFGEGGGHGEDLFLGDFAADEFR